MLWCYEQTKTTDFTKVHVYILDLHSVECADYYFWAQEVRWSKHNCYLPFISCVFTLYDVQNKAAFFFIIILLSTIEASSREHRLTGKM